MNTVTMNSASMKSTPRKSTKMNVTKLLIAITPYAWEHLPAGKPLKEIYELNTDLTSQTTTGNCAANVLRELMFAQREMETAALSLCSSRLSEVRVCMLSASEASLWPSLIALTPGERERELCFPREVRQVLPGTNSRQETVKVRFTDRVKRMVFSWFALDSETVQKEPNKEIYQTRVIPAISSWAEMEPGLTSLRDWCIPPGKKMAGNELAGNELGRLAVVARVIEPPSASAESPALMALKVRLSEFFEQASRDGCGLIQLDLPQ